MEDKSKRTETVRPPLSERCDSVLSATNDENDVELNGETDDEDGEMGFDDGSEAKEHPRPRTTDRQGAPRAHDHSSTVQIMVQVLCDGTRGERTAQEI